MPTAASAIAAAADGTARRNARGTLYGLTWLLLAANALPTFIGEAVAAHGWGAAALNLFDVSAVVWAALVAGAVLAWRDRGRGVDWLDGALIAFAVAAALTPVPALSGACLTVVSLGVLLRSERGSPLFRAATVFLSLSTFFFWGRLLLALGAGPLLGADAALVGLVSGMPVTGNIVAFADGSRFLIAPGCSSLHGLSLVLILWTAALAWFDLAPNRMLIGVLVAALAASIAVNAARLATIAWNPTQFDYWHTGQGAALYGWAALIVTGAIVYWGIGRALDAR